MVYGGWNGVFCIYCVNCAQNVYQGTRGNGVYGYIYEGECGDSNNPFAATNTYLKDIKIDDIGDREMYDSRAIYGVPDEYVYLTTNGMIPGVKDIEGGERQTDMTDDITDDMTDITDDMCMRKLRDKAFKFIELEEDEDAELENIPPLKRQDATVRQLTRYDDNLELENIPPLKRQDATVSHLTRYDDNLELDSETGDEYFELLKASASIQDNDPFILENMYFGMKYGVQLGAASPLRGDFVSESEEDYSDMPALISVSDDESDEDYSDMPPLIPDYSENIYTV